MAFPAHNRSAVRLAAIVATAGIALSLTACATSSEEETTSGNAAVSPPTIISEGTLTICTTDVPPNNFFDENNEHQGIEIGVAEAIAENLGLSAAFETYSFNGLIPALSAQQCDAIMGSMYINSEREEVVDFVPYLNSGTAVAVSPENPANITGYDDSLCGATIVVINGSTGASFAEERVAECEAEGNEAPNLTIIDTGTDGLQQVIAGQADAFINTLEQISYYSNDAEADIEMAGDPFGKVQIGAATLKDNSELHEAMDTAFQTVLEDGTYEDLLAEWNAQDSDVTQAE